MRSAVGLRLAAAEEEEDADAAERGGPRWSDMSGDSESASSSVDTPPPSALLLPPTAEERGKPAADVRALDTTRVGCPLRVVALMSAGASSSVRSSA